MALGNLMLDLEGQSISEQEKKLLNHPHVGGVILFTRNYANPSQLRELIQDIRKLRPEILIAVDQEGGRVQRFREGFTRLPEMAAFRHLYIENPEAAKDLLTNCGWLMASELLAMDIDFSLTPVLDVDHAVSQVIGDRAFSHSANEIVELAGAFIQGMHQAGMAATGKHFPGHGAVVVDSHVDLPVDNRSFDEILNVDLLPYKQLIPQGLDAVMPAHIVYPQVDKQPAGFSKFWIETVLRQRLDFHGVVFSDDLTMEGAAVAGTYADRAAIALEAGCDMLLVCNNRSGTLETLDYLQKRGTFPLARLQNMKHCGAICDSHLKNSHRWQSCCEQLQALNS